MAVIGFEAAFASLIAAARTLPEMLMVGAAEGLNGEVAGDEFPTSTALRMQHWANVQFEAAVSLLADEATAAAAEVLLRSLLEACAHLHFIAAGPTRKERTCRAIGTEWGMANEMVGMAQKFSGMESEARGRLLAEGRSRQQLLQVDHYRQGCKGGPRSYGSVGSTPEEMVTKEPQLDWTLDMYLVASGVAHQLLLDRIMRDVGGGRIAHGDATTVGACRTLRSSIGDYRPGRPAGHRGPRAGRSR